jgi:uncharacterized membrane protein YdjX (TVP38/TMEM64 family)
VARIALVAVLVGAVAVGVRWGLRQQLDPPTALALLRTVQGHWWAVPVFLLVYLAATGLFLPAVLFHMLSGVAWGFGPGLALNLLAVNLSANLQFALGRWLGRARVERWFAGTRLKAFDGVAERHGFRAVVAIRMFPVPHLAVNLGAGISAIRWRDFALGSGVGTLPIMVIYTYFASSLVEGVAGAQQRALWQTAVAGALVFLFTYLPRLLSWLRGGGQRTTPR